MQGVVCLGLIVGLLRCCSAEVINCTVTQEKDQTLYSVGEYTGSDSDFSWIKNETVISTVKGKHELVVTWTNRTLITHKCYEEINFTCECFSGPQFSASCTTKCSENAGLQKDEGTPAIHWIVPLAVFLLLVVGGICMSVYVFAYRRGKCSGRVNRQNQQGDRNVV